MPLGPLIRHSREATRLNQILNLGPPTLCVGRSAELSLLDTVFAEAGPLVVTSMASAASARRRFSIHSRAAPGACALPHCCASTAAASSPSAA